MKSFGLIEAIAASTIIIIIVAGALSLSTYSIRSTANDSAYFEAENISESLFEKINEKKSAGLATFFAGENSSTSAFPIDCFDYSQAQNPLCAATGLDFTNIKSDYFTPYVFTGVNPAYAPGFFSWKIVITKPLADPNATGYSRTYNDNFTACKAVSGVSIPPEKCRMIHVEVKWSDQGRDKNYTASQYITGWER
jgi:hypothetical protein